MFVKLLLKALHNRFSTRVSIHWVQSSSSLSAEGSGSCWAPSITQLVFKGGLESCATHPSIVSICIQCIIYCRWTLDILLSKLQYAKSQASIFSHLESLSHRECLTEFVSSIIAWNSSGNFGALLSNRICCWRNYTINFWTGWQRTSYDSWYCSQNCDQLKTSSFVSTSSYCRILRVKALPNRNH